MSDLLELPRTKLKTKQRVGRYLPTQTVSGHSAAQRQRDDNAVNVSEDKKIFAYVKRGTSAEIVRDRPARVFRGAIDSQLFDFVIANPPYGEPSTSPTTHSTSKQASEKLRELAVDVGLMIDKLREETNAHHTWETLVKKLREVLHMRLLFDDEPSQAARRSFLRKAAELEKEVDLGTALDLIYDSIDELLRANEFVELDGVLQRIVPEDFSTDLLIAVLTATLPAKSHLPSRVCLRATVEQTLRNRNEFEDGLLAGL